MKNTVLIICLFSTIMLPAQNKKITGSKIKKTQIFPTEKFHRVNVSFGGNITIDCGKMPKVEINTSENLFEYLNVKVKDKTLYISSTKWIEDYNSIVKIQVPFLTEISESSSGNTLVNDLNSTGFKLNCGSGNVTITGKTKTFLIEGSGGGNINASNLSCLVATIDKTGAGNISLAATDSLIIKKNHGSITYLENPQIVFEEGVESDYVMRQDEQIKAKEELHYIKFTIKNSSSSRQDFYIKGPSGHPFSYGFPMKSKSTRVETAPVGTRIWLINKVGIRTKLLLTVSENDEGKSIDLFTNQK